MSRVRYNPPVLFHKTAFLQGLQEAVGNGYVHYVLGEVPVSRVAALAWKFADLYRVDADKRERHERKVKGLGNARLFLHSSTDPLAVSWALLVTRGEQPAHRLEKLLDAAHRPVTCGEFELVRLTAKGRDKPALTWRWTSDTVAAWQERLHLHTAHYDAPSLYRDFYSLYRVPGFAGVRKQVGELVAYWRRDWQKLRGDAPCPICYPHDEFRFRAIPGVARRDDGLFWTTKGFPSIRQLPTLYYVRKYVSPFQSLTAFVRSTEAALGGMSLVDACRDRHPRA